MLNSVGQDPKMIPLPNDTRVSGQFLLVQGSLCCMNGLRLYALKTASFEPKNLSRQEWKQVAEFEAVMAVGHLLGFDSQSDRPEVAAEMPLRLSLLKTHYEEEDEWEVVDVTKDWRANASLDELPRLKMTTSEEKAEEDSLPLMSEASRALVKRFVASYAEYFGEINSDRLLAMLVHPLLGTQGFDEVSNTCADSTCYPTSFLNSCIIIIFFRIVGSLEARGR